MRRAGWNGGETTATKERGPGKRLSAAGAVHGLALGRQSGQSRHFSRAARAKLDAGGSEIALRP